MRGSRQGDYLPKEGDFTRKVEARHTKAIQIIDIERSGIYCSVTDTGSKTTIRLTAADRKILKKLTELTGLKNSQLIRAALRTMLRRIETN